MNKLGLVALLMVTIVACSDQANLLAPDSPSETRSADIDWSAFTSTPPDPAVVGDTYEVTTLEFFMVHSSTPAVCTVPAPNTAPVTATFAAAGTCTLEAYCIVCPPEMTGEGTRQTVEVIERRGSDRAPVIPGIPPRGRP